MKKSSVKKIERLNEKVQVLEIKAQKAIKGGIVIEDDVIL